MAFSNGQVWRHRIDYPWEVWYPEEFRYYYNDNCVTQEPPPTAPAYYDWDSNTIPGRPFNEAVRIYNANCNHPQ